MLKGGAHKPPSGTSISISISSSDALRALFNGRVIVFAAFFRPFVTDLPSLDEALDIFDVTERFEESPEGDAGDSSREAEPAIYVVMCDVFVVICDRVLRSLAMKGIYVHLPNETDVRYE